MTTVADSAAASAEAAATPAATETPAATQACTADSCSTGRVCCQSLTSSERVCAASCPVGTARLGGNSEASNANGATSNNGGTSGGTLVNPLKATSIPELLTIVLRGLVQIGSIILVLMLVWVGFMFVLAQGNEEKVKSARQALMWTVVGGLVLLGATAIAELIEATVTAL